MTSCLTGGAIYKDAEILLSSFISLLFKSLSFIFS